MNYRCRASLLPGICLTTAGRAPCKLRGATLLGMQNPTLQQCKLLGVQIHEPLRMSYSYVSPPGLRAALHRSPTSPSQEGVGLADARKPFTLRDRVSLLRRWSTFNSFTRRTSPLSRRIRAPGALSTDCAWRRAAQPLYGGGSPPPRMARVNVPK